MNITVCIGSSCHIKGSRQVVEQLQYLIRENNLGDKITLAGSFCTGKCNRVGVTITVDDDVCTSVTPENLESFFEEKVMTKIHDERK